MQTFRNRSVISSAITGDTVTTRRVVLSWTAAATRHLRELLEDRPGATIIKVTGVVKRDDVTPRIHAAVLSGLIFLGSKVDVFLTSQGSELGPDSSP